MKIEDFKSLKEIHEYFAVHNRCILKRSATQPVYETQKPKSGIVFIGEAPGLNEDKEGKPFVGAAGKLLDQLLSNIGYKREDVYVTNVVKYRPPNNRDPLPEEKDACRTWVNAELLHIKPKVIIPLGKHALERFIPDLKISLAHGQAYEHSTGIPIFAMYHPAVALYNPTLKSTLKKDFERLKNFLDGKIQIQKFESEEIDTTLSTEKQNLVDDLLKL
ncbi:uracil-DNA glycosylase [Candidatus Dojkabacteria bacterium HGW-Dojkabacteria-1]|uniref:Type-4 uracil-DNA glycosylase n=1 Tax=Candidatus Dojkabacteria bacterium HGW-Dojkabacteria-1 TaxID=2013761 RepID=A0A2N2F3E1_9BACT|nr:MAG: uracil-DNA glycosylase [Candidatus Dojkabacteria bacterium HGW-Dojkabacteria-1]